MDATAAILAGGLGRRIGGDKACVQLAGRPLISYAIDVARSAGLGIVVVAKRTTRLPPLDVPILLEPDQPTHPLLGVITALQHHPAIIALPSDMPFVTAAQLTALASATADVAVLAREQPFPALYRRACLPQLSEALEANRSVRSTQAQSLLAPAAVSSTDPATRMTVNTPDDLAAAERLIKEH